MATRKLLLADDSVTIQKVVNLTFADEGMDVTSVGDGDRAIEKIETLMPDIVLADVHMPGLNGYQVCNHIKRLPHLRHIPVILLVGSFEPFDEEEARRVGADDYLTKPFQSIRQLVSRVNALLPEYHPQPVEEEEKLQPITGELLQPEPLSSVVEPPRSPVTEIWTPAPSPSFSDSVIDDELLEATSLADSESTAEKQPTYSSAPRETTRLSAEEIREFDINMPPVTSTPQYDEVEAETPPPSQDYFSPVPIEVETEVEKVIMQPEPFFIDEPIASTQAASPYSTTPLSEDTLLDFSYGETIVDEVEEDDSILDLGEDIYAPPVAATPVAAPVIEEVLPVNAEAATMFETAAVNETQNGEDIDMPSSIETVSTSPVIETINVPSVSMNTGGSLSPEAIEAIARRVVEMLSDKTVREIAWEVVPELADLHIKRKMQEEKS